MTEPSKMLELWGGAPARRKSDGLTTLRHALMVLDDERQRLAEIGDYESLAGGGQDLQTLHDELGAVLRSTRVDIARILDENETALRAWERDAKLAEGAKVPKRLEPGASLGPCRTEIDGVGAVEVHGGFDRKNWQSPELLRRMLHIALDGAYIFDPETGEDARDDTIERVIAVLAEVMPLTKSMAWRTGTSPANKEPTGLRKFSIDDRDFCDRTEKPRLATIPKANR